MNRESIITVLTEIRDQQRQQITNFESAIKLQEQYADIQRKGRQTFLFMIYAPWAVMVLLGLMLFARI